MENKRKKDFVELYEKAEFMYDNGQLEEFKDFNHLMGNIKLWFDNFGYKKVDTWLDARRINIVRH